MSNPFGWLRFLIAIVGIAATVLALVPFQLLAFGLLALGFEPARRVHRFCRCWCTAPSSSCSAFACISSAA